LEYLQDRLMEYEEEEGQGMLSEGNF
jgi:hypothetical protein